MSKLGWLNLWRKCRKMTHMLFSRTNSIVTSYSSSESQNVLWMTFLSTKLGVLELYNWERSAYLQHTRGRDQGIFRFALYSVVLFHLSTWNKRPVLCDWTLFAESFCCFRIWIVSDFFRCLRSVCFWQTFLFLRLSVLISWWILGVLWIKKHTKYKCCRDRLARSEDLELLTAKEKTRTQAFSFSLWQCVIPNLQIFV